MVPCKLKNRVPSLIVSQTKFFSESSDEDNQSEVNYDLPPSKILAQQARRKGIIDNKGSFHEVFSVILVM